MTARFSAVLAAIAAALLGAAQPAAAATLFSDNFDDGDVTDWALSTNHNNAFLIASTEAKVSAPYALEAYFSPGNAGVNLFARATRTISFATAVTNVHLIVDARTRPCGGCTMYYDVLFDNVSLLHVPYSTTNFTHYDLALGDLAAGTHSITLGHFSTNASSGRFSAFFDNVLLTGALPAVPEPASWALMVAGFGLVGGAMRRRLAMARA